MTPLLPLGRNPKFVRLWTARVVARFGSALSFVVLLWLTYDETGSALAVAYVSLAGFLPTVVIGLLTGALVDRFDRRRVVFVSVLGRAASMGALVVVLEVVGFRLPFLVAAAFVFAVFGTLFGPGSQALLPELVGRESLAEANGLLESTESVAGIVGSSLAGVLIVAIGAVPSLGFDAAAYLVAALILLLIGASLAPPAARAVTTGLLDEVREGLRYLRRARVLLEITIASLVINFLTAFIFTFLVVYSTELLHGTALVFATLEALGAAGWGLGGLLVGRLRLARATGRLWVYSAFGEGLVFLALIELPSVWVAAPLLFFLGIGNGILNVAWLSTIQATVPERMLGRYLATDNMVSYAAIPLSQLVGGVLIAAEGVSFTFVLAGVGMVVAGAILLTRRDLLRFGYEPGRPT